MNRFHKVFKNTKCAIIGMIHVKALPGTPKYGGSVQKIIDEACKEYELYESCNLDGVMIENMNDIPYVQSEHFTPETTAMMTRICTDIKNNMKKKIPCGVQVLACGVKESLAISLACDFDFIRAEGFVFGHIGDEGPTWACAGSALRYRSLINAQDVMIWSDIKKKHSSHAITNDLSLLDTAKAAEFFMTDGLIITGSETGSPANPEELQILKQQCKTPVIIGSGVTLGNLNEFFAADAVIVGSYFKNNGYWANELNKDRIDSFMNEVNNLRQNIR